MPPVPITPAPAATTPTSQPQAGGDPTETISLEEARKLRSEAANLRKRMKAFEDAEAAAQAASLTEVERLKKQHADLQTQHNALIAEAKEIRLLRAVELSAIKLEFKHPEIAAKLLDRADLEYEEDGSTPKNISKLLEKLLKNMPELAKEQAPTQQASNGTAPTAGTPPAPTMPTPALPAMNPGRSSIAAPNSLPPGKVTRLTDIPWSR